MATQKQINTIISEISSAEEPGSVTNVMVGTVLDHLNTGAVNRESEIAGLTEKVDAAKDAADKAQTTADKAQTQANKAYNEAIAAHEAAVAAFPIARGVALENNVNTLNDNLDSLAGRHNALADTVKAMGASSSGIHKVIEEDVDSISEPGIYEVEDEDSVNRYFIFHTKYKRSRPGSQSPLKTIQYKLCDGQISVRQKTTEDYGDWKPIGEGISELDTRVTTLESNLNAFKVVNKAFIEKMEDSGEIEEGVFYEEGSGTLYFFTYSFVFPSETKISHAGVSSRTYKDGAWTDWSNKAEELAEAAKGAIYTEDSIDSLRKPQVYTLKDGSLLVVTRTIGERITTYRQFHFADNGDILFRVCSNNAINWTAWQSIASVKTAQTTAEDALTTANKALADGVYIMFHRKSDNYPVLAHPEQWQSISQSGEVADGVLVMGAGLNVLVAPTDAGPDGMLVSNDAFPFNIYLNRADAMRDFNGSGFTAEMLAANDSANNLADKENAPGFCYAYYRDNGSGGGLGYNRSSGYGTWWMPSLAELMLIFAHKQKINYCLGMIPGAQKIREVWHHSSTMKANGLNWQFGMHNGNIDEWGPCYIARGAVRPVSTFIR